MPRSLTQCTLWRRPTRIYARGITARVFFDILLPRYGTIISGRQQTGQGQDYWLARMADAVTRGNTVGLADLNTRTTAWFGGHHDGFDPWLRQQDACAPGRREQALRRVIAEPGATPGQDKTGSSTLTNCNRAPSRSASAASGSWTR